MAQFVAGIPETVPLSSVNRQCSSGLQAVATIANAIKAGQIVGGIGAGVESMTHGGGVADPNSAPPPININDIMEFKLAKDSLTPMGITSENVAARYGVSRAEQDALAVRSHEKAIAATKSGHFAKEIVPITVTVEVDDEDQEITVTEDEGPRPGTTQSKLATLKAVFKKDGSTTAGNASQVSDGAAAVVLMKRSKAVELGLPILGAYRGYQVVGVQPDEMGVGPAVAIPAVLKECGLTTNDIDVFEINEAFASQAAYCIKKLGIPMEKVNPNGGAIALGHPLGCTGARQVATLFNELHRQKKPLGVISMCIGTGMGAAAVFEAEF
jgi:acetyl-CoA acyltransferase 1